MGESRVAGMMISLRDHFKIRVTDWLLSAILFSWGFALFATDPRVWALPTFTGLAAIASQRAWAIISVSLGLTRLLALFVNGTVRRSPHARGVCAFLSCFIWAELTLGVAWADYTGPGIGLFPWLLLADALNTIRAARDARASDDRAEQRRRSLARVPQRA
jgi:hypothetical protein